jgi:3-(3-hydroxy-phenyl)propionate hydroxylase
MDAPAAIRLGAANVSVSFRVRWFGVVRVRGRFAGATGSLTVPCDVAEEAAVSVQVESASVITGISLRDRHLRGPRFLDSGQHPLIRFDSERVRRHNGVWDIRGRLTLRGHQREVSASVLDEPSGTDRRLTAAFSVSRRPHAIGTARGIRRLNPLLWAIGDEVELRVELVVPATILQRAMAHAPAR